MSPVHSYYVDTPNGGKAIVNVTMDGHPLSRGVVIQAERVGSDGQNQIGVYGEGTSMLQDSDGPIGRYTAGFIDGVWPKVLKQTIARAKKDGAK